MPQAVQSSRPHRRRRRRMWAWRIVVVGILGGVHPSFAANLYDPNLTYHTVQSDHFAVHYPDGARNLGIRVMRIGEAVLQEDAALFGHAPTGRIEVILTDSQDDANGSAQVIPKNILRLYLAAPTELTGLSNYDDWLRTLLTHELAHICDIDHTEGIHKVLRHVFGQTIMPNGWVPQFLSEGVAVFAETKLSHNGRGRASYVEMLLRTAALDDTFIGLDQAHILYADFPGGNVAYFYGGRFHLYLAERLGTRAVTDLHHYYAGQLIPYVYYPGAKAIFGASLPALWADFRQAELAYAKEVRASVLAHGITPSTPLTHHGRYSLAARYTPDGRAIVYSRNSPVDGSTLRIMDVDGSHDRFLALDTLSPRLSFAADGAALYYSMASITHRFDSFNDLYRYDLVRGRRERLYDVMAPGAPLRARDPTLSPDGTTLVFVQTALEQSYLSRATFDANDHSALHISTLVGPSGEVQHSRPVFSPSGDLLAVSVQFAGGLRDLVLLDAHTGAHHKRLTYDKALEDNPAFSPDGRFVLYESDADGISNLYAFELATECYFRLTHVVGGAFQPDVSPDGQSILFRNASGHGFDIHTMPFDPNTWEPQAYDPNTGYTPLSGAAAAEPSAAMPVPPVGAPNAGSVWANAPAAAQSAADWRHVGVPNALTRAQEPRLVLGPGETEMPYSPWPSLLPFHDNWNLQPNLYILNNDPFVSLSTFGQDALLYHSYQLSLGVSYYGQHPNIALYYAFDRYRPTYAVSLSDSATTYQTAPGRAVVVNRQAQVGISWPWRNRHALGLSYRLAHVSGNLRAPLVTNLGAYGSVSAGYSYSFAHRFAYSVGAEHGRAISVSLTEYSRALGGDYEQLLGSFDGRAYINNPLFDNHVLALRLVGNYAIGRDHVQNFFLYGTQGNSVLTAQSGQLFPLRGFVPGQRPFGAPSPGTALVAGYGEYRFALWHIQHGIFSWPIYVQRLHGALFADAGTTFDRIATAQGHQVVPFAQGMRQIWLSTGAEMRLDIAWAWAVPLTLRAGIAVPTLVRGQAAPTFSIVPYLDVGTAI